MAKDIALDDNPEDVEVDEEADEKSPGLTEQNPDQMATQLTELKALAYDHLSTIERLQTELRRINEVIRQLNEKLNPVEQEVEQ